MFSAELRLTTYRRLLEEGYPLPPLNTPQFEQSSVEEFPDLSQMDQSHEDALFNVLDAEGWFEDPYW